MFIHSLTGVDFYEHFFCAKLLHHKHYSAIIKVQTKTIIKRLMQLLFSQLVVAFFLCEKNVTNCLININKIIFLLI
jgi:hypothetical protein